MSLSQENIIREIMALFRSFNKYKLKDLGGGGREYSDLLCPTPQWFPYAVHKLAFKYSPNGK